MDCPSDGGRFPGWRKRPRFVERDLFTADIKDATVITLFLTPTLNLRLRPKLRRDLKPGTRVISHLYDMGDWKPDKIERVRGRPVYCWAIPPDAAFRASAAHE
jgi:hypothetical protein